MSLYYIVVVTFFKALPPKLTQVEIEDQDTEFGDRSTFPDRLALS